LRRRDGEKEKNIERESHREREPSRERAIERESHREEARTEAQHLLGTFKHQPTLVERLLEGLGMMEDSMASSWSNPARWGSLSLRTLDGEVGEWMNGSGEAKNEDSGTRRGLGYEGKGMECGRKDLEARESRWRGRVKTAILKSTNGSRTNGQSLESRVRGGLVVMVEGFVTLILVVHQERAVSAERR
jgi:hypothetical protein